MYQDKGLIKVFNGKKFKIVSYLKQGNCIIFTTSMNSKKYQEFLKNGTIRVLQNRQEYSYKVEIETKEEAVDTLFNLLKTHKAIPKIIPRKYKCIVSFNF